MTTYLLPITITETSNKKLIEQLDSIPLTRIEKASFAALMRLQLYFTGRTQELLLQFVADAQALIMKRGGNDQLIDGVTGLNLQTELVKMWSDSWANWMKEFEQARKEAGMIAFGVAAVFHDRLIVPAAKKQMSEAILNEATVVDGVYDPQLKILLNTAENYLYGDSLNLSGRIWRIDREARNGITDVIMKGVTNQDSAWNMAQELEQFLGTDQDCPRWTSTRLYGLTKTQIAQGDTTGLQTRSKGAMRGSLTLMAEDSPCNGRGVAYNALRLARTEIQKIHALATDRMLAKQPWVQNEKINISPSHGEPDECDEAAKGGVNHDGIYPVGTIELPLHPHCLCFKTADLMPEKEFTSKLNGWLKGEQDWAEMDSYADDLGVDLSVSHTPATLQLAVWMFSTQLKDILQ